MRTKTFSLAFMLIILSLWAYNQQIPGTAPEGYSGGGSRSNGLTELYSVSGHYELSVDGAGHGSAPYTINVNKPSPAATVQKAYFMAASTGWFGIVIPNGFITLNAIPINWDVIIPAGIPVYNHYADVTTLISSVMNPAPVGITPLIVTESNYYDVDGVALLVVFADPGATEKTIVIMFGALSTTGDNFAITLSQPIDPLATGSVFNMGLGISYSYQVGGVQQYSIIDVNSQRLTTAAGGGDDAQSAIQNGTLITVGGFGDANTNPANPNATPTNDYSDDELYSLLPLITNTTTNILVTTSNPSNDDNIFLSYFEISGTAIIGEGILLSQESDTNCLNTNHQVMALVQDVTGAPVVGTMVYFDVISGPNAGESYSELTDNAGKAYFTYVGNGGAGTDLIQACFYDSQQVYQCSNILDKEWIQCEDVPISDWAVIIGVLLILTFAIIRMRKF